MTIGQITALLTDPESKEKPQKKGRFTYAQANALVQQWKRAKPA